MARSLLGVLTVGVFGSAALVMMREWPIPAVVFAGLTLLRLRLLVKQWPRGREEPEAD